MAAKKTKCGSWKKIGPANQWSLGCSDVGGNENVIAFCGIDYSRGGRSIYTVSCSAVNVDTNKTTVGHRDVNTITEAKRAANKMLRGFVQTYKKK